MSLVARIGDASLVAADPAMVTGGGSEDFSGARLFPVVPAPSTMVIPRQLPRARPFSGSEARIRASERALYARLGPPAVRVPTRASSLVPNVGDTLSFYADSSRFDCQADEQVRGVVRLVGDHVIWIEDVANPSAGFTTTELRSLDDFYATQVKPVHDLYYGSVADIDFNGRIQVLVTKEVNEQDLAGYTFAGDLLPFLCTASNKGEILFAWAPDPEGRFGQKLTKEEALRYFPNLLAHEFTHIVQHSARLNGAGPKSDWEMEGGATLAEELVAFGLFGHESGQDLEATQYEAGEYWYFNTWVRDLVKFFGAGSGAEARAPHECSWLGYESDGNDGPCGDKLLYGMGSLVLRAALDRAGGGDLQLEARWMRSMTQDRRSGFATLERATGMPVGLFLASFYAALWGDGRYFDSPAMTSWNLWSVLERFPSAELKPLESGSAPPSRVVSVRGGSSAFFRWTPEGPFPPTSFQVVAPSGEPVAGATLWVLRVH
jgi:hypothetical protein